MFNHHPKDLVAYDTPLETAGRIVMSGMPGIYIEENGALTLSERLLHSELTRLKKLNVELLVSLVEDEELGCVAFEDIADHATKLGLATERFRIVDYGAPASKLASDWSEIRSDTTALLKRARGVAFHCMAGIGRSGMMTGALLVHLGLSPETALKTVRIGQPEALESEAQVSYLLTHQADPSAIAGNREHKQLLKSSKIGSPWAWSRPGFSVGDWPH